MQDEIFLAMTILFFAVSLAYVVFCERVGMSSGPSIMLVICAGLLVYLVRVPSTFRSILMTPIRTCRLESAHHKSLK